MLYKKIWQVLRKERQMRNKIIEYVKKQINIDLDFYRTEFTKYWERENEIIIEYREMPRTDWRNVELLASSPNSHIRIENVGVWGKMIAYK